MTELIMFGTVLGFIFGAISTWSAQMPNTDTDFQTAVLLATIAVTFLGLAFPLAATAPIIGGIVLGLVVGSVIGVYDDYEG